MGDSVILDGVSSTDAKGFDSFQLRLGDIMRGERATLGKSLLDVQRDLRIKATYIAAIENCDTSAFQTPGFIAGYVRSYARYLGLDAEDTFALFCVEARFNGVHAGIQKKLKSKPAPKATSFKPIAAAVQTERKSDPIYTGRSAYVPVGEGLMAQVSPSGLGSIVVLAVLILGLGYGAWTVLQDIQRVEFTPIEDNTTIIGGVPVADSDGPLVPDPANQAALDALYRPQELEVPVMTPRDGPIAALNPDRIGALVTNNGGLNAREAAALMAADAPRVTGPAAPRVAIIASRPAWVRVSRADGTILFEKILDGGESFLLPKDASETSLRAGNSGAVYLSLDGQFFGPVGHETAVVKDVALAPVSILERYSAVSDDLTPQQLQSPRVITLNDIAE